MTSTNDTPARVEELSTNLTRVEGRIHAACTAAGRARADVRLIVVTKFFPSDDVEALAQLGVTDIGENRDQEASTKIAAPSCPLHRSAADQQGRLCGGLCRHRALDRPGQAGHRA